MHTCIIESPLGQTPAPATHLRLPEPYKCRLRKMKANPSSSRTRLSKQLRVVHRGPRARRAVLVPNTTTRTHRQKKQGASEGRAAGPGEVQAGPGAGARSPRRQPQAGALQERAAAAGGRALPRPCRQRHARLCESTFFSSLPRCITNSALHTASARLGHLNAPGAPERTKYLHSPTPAGRHPEAPRGAGQVRRGALRRAGGAAGAPAVRPGGLQRGREPAPGGLRRAAAAGGGRGVDADG
jgi:hypothetical protein